MDRLALLGLLFETPEYQTQRFMQKRQINPGDDDAFRQRVGETGKKLLRRLNFNQTPENLTYPVNREERRNLQTHGLKPTRQRRDRRRQERRDGVERPEFWATPKDVSHEKRGHLARTLRFLQRSGIAGGGRHDQDAARIGYLRLTFHPDDDKKHGNKAHERSRQVMNHIIKHYPDLPIEYSSDEEYRGGETYKTHHLEIPHHDIPRGMNPAR